MGSEDDSKTPIINYIGVIGDGTGGMESYLEEEPKEFLDYKTGELSINDFI